MVLSPDRLGLGGSFEAADDEVAARHLLKMIDEDRVDGGASGRADQRDRLGRYFFGHDRTESRSDGADEPDKSPCALLDQQVASRGCYTETGPRTSIRPRKTVAPDFTKVNHRLRR